jgi:hypothetical protein
LRSFFQHSSNAELEQREADLKALMVIRAEQEAAWLHYLLARRDYANALKECIVEMEAAAIEHGYRHVA